MICAQPVFSVAAVHNDRSVQLRLGGDLDLATVAKFRAVVNELFDSHVKALTVDLTTLAFVDVAGLRALAEVGRTTTDTGADYRLTGVNAFTLRIIRLVGYDDLERACETVGD